MNKFLGIPLIAIMLLLFPTFDFSSFLTMYICIYASGIFIGSLKKKNFKNRVKVKYLTHFVYSIVIFLSALLPVDAHSGRTDAYGCHSCYTSYCYGQYHCHNDGYYNYSPPVVYEFPEITAEFEWIPNTSSKTFTLRATLNDATPSQYSAVLSKCMGCDPGPLADFDTNYFIFYNIPPGRYFLNVKKNILGYWSTVSYWTIDIPNWYMPPPTSTPIPTATPIPTSRPFTSYISINNVGYVIQIISLGLIVCLIFLIFN